MSGRYTLYGWQVSYFAGKVRCYLEYKRIPYTERPINLWELMVTIKRRTGASVMPVVVTPEGRWLQDSSDIIDHLEARFPERPVVPDTPAQRAAAYLLEAWGDEWWVPVAMHTRWSYPENYALFEREVGRDLLPGFPRFVQARAVAHVAHILRGMLHAVGIRHAQHDWLLRWTTHMLDLLEAHFRELPYLLGHCPSLADFGLVGTLYGHLGRDPWPARELVAPRPHLRAWIDRMAHPPAQPLGDWLPGDAIAPTLRPVLQVIGAEFVPMVAAINDAVHEGMARWTPGRPLPRGLRDITIPSQHGPFQRAALPYTLWMAQRVRDVVCAAAPHEQQAMRAALAEWGAADLLTLPLPRLERHALRVALAPAGNGLRAPA